jgi:hypothetical protein
MPVLVCVFFSSSFLPHLGVLSSLSSLLLLLPMLLHSFAYMQVSEESQVCSVFP